MRFLFVVHKNEEKAEQNSVLFHRLTLKERGLRPNGYFPLMRQPLFSCGKGFILTQNVDWECELSVNFCSDSRLNI